MEKITYAPLISHLKERHDYYNQLLRENEIRYGAVDQYLFSYWMVCVIEPITKELDPNPEVIGKVLKVFYVEMLQMLGNQSGVVHEDEYTKAWLLCSKIPKLIETYPSRVLKAINSAVESVRLYQPAKVLEWIAMMDKGIDATLTIDEFLSLGRICAWLCGLAHLRKRAEEEFSMLRADLKNELSSKLTDKGVLERLFKKEWNDINQPTFIGESGGYVGFGGNFSSPPLVALVSGQIIATDRKSSTAFFADSFGKVLLNDIPVSPENVIRLADVKALDSIKSKTPALIPFDDTSSAVMKDSTLVVTRKSSYYLYVYGWTK